jgi:hypothetical protein
MHRFAEQIFAQHRPQHRLAIAATRKGRAPRSFQMDVAPLSLTVDHFAQKQRSAISQLRRETAELVPGIGHG